MNPSKMLVDQKAIEMMRRVLAEAKALAEVRSPVGLARLFPGLKRG